MDVDDDTPAPKDISAIVRVLGEQNITVTELVTLLLTEKQYKKNSLTRDLIKNAEFMLPHILGHSHLPDSARNVACALVEPMYAREVRDLAGCGDWHFGAQKVAPEDLEDFKLKEIAEAYAKRAPRLWSLLDSLLKARKRGTSLLLQSNDSDPVAGSPSEPLEDLFCTLSSILTTLEKISYCQYHVA